MTDWNDPSWEAEFELGKIYQARVLYVDGYEEVGMYRYTGPQINPQPINGLEYLIMPRFERVDQGHVGHAQMFEVISV